MYNVINIRTGEPLLIEQTSEEVGTLTQREKNIRALIETVLGNPGVEVLRGNKPMFHTMNLTLEEVEKCVPENLRKQVNVDRLFFVLKLILDQKESIQRAISMAEAESVS